MKPKRDPQVFRSKELDERGTLAQVFQDGKVRIMPPASEPAPPVTFSRQEFATMAQFVRWCLGDLDKKS